MEASDDDPGITLPKGLSKDITNNPQHSLDRPSWILGFYQSALGGGLFSPLLDSKRKGRHILVTLEVSAFNAICYQSLYRSIVYSPAMRYPLPANATDEEEFDTAGTVQDNT